MTPVLPRLLRWLPPLLALAFCTSQAQAPRRAEKLEGKLRVEYIKATRDIKIPVIKAAELLKVIDDTDLVLIDVRQAAEQQVSMLPHALTPVSFASRFKKGIPPGKRLVVYCTIGYRSGKYAEQLEAQGIKSENLEGGILAWTFVGGDLLAADSSGQLVKTKRVHVYAKEWNIVRPDYQGVYE